VNQDEAQFLEVGAGPSARRIAFRRTAPERQGSPGVVWFGGFKSDMQSTKAIALDEHCRQRGREFLRFDYSGHGDSSGAFEEGTITRWLDESLAVLRLQTDGPQVVVGSSMGGYLTLLLARALEKAGETERLAGMVLIAPAVDFTEKLIWERAPEAARRAILETGAWMRPSAYSSEPYAITRALIEDGRKHLLLGQDIVRSHCPVRILQGMQDEDVPYRHAMTLIEHMAADPVALTLIRDGEHRLSRPQDLALLFEALDAFG